VSAEFSTIAVVFDAGGSVVNDVAGAVVGVVVVGAAVVAAALAGGFTEIVGGIVSVMVDPPCAGPAERVAADDDVIPPPDWAFDDEAGAWVGTCGFLDGAGIWRIMSCEWGRWWWG